MSRSTDFSRTTREGRRAKRGCLMVYVADPRAEGQEMATGEGETRVGLIVGRSVGNAVERHRVSRILRHGLAPRLGVFPRGSSVVVRALPFAGGRGNHEITRDLDRCLSVFGDRAND